jgi:uncharacterized alkaline shock family protein YloU/predicted RNA-binding Zn-ribbon protein involved in translation (DUF1610 family)
MIDIVIQSMLDNELIEFYYEADESIEESTEVVEEGYEAVAHCPMCDSADLKDLKEGRDTKFGSDYRCNKCYYFFNADEAIMNPLQANACPSCGCKFNGNLEECPNTGCRQKFITDDEDDFDDTLVCAACGEEPNPDTNYCSECGEYIEPVPRGSLDEAVTDDDLEPLTIKEVVAEATEETLEEMDGVAEGLTVEDIAEHHGVDVQLIEQQLAKGIQVESEHSSDVDIATNIAMDHLYEIPDYYDKLEEIEVPASEEDYVDGN